MTQTDIGRRRRIAGNALIGLFAGVLIVSGAGKFTHPAGMVAHFHSWGFTGPWVDLLGVLEVTVGVLLAVGRWRSLGVLLASGYLGGAIATHIQHAELFPAALIPAVLLALGWLGVWLRHPVVLWSIEDHSVGVVDATRAARRVAPERTFEGRTIA
jgi:uncharacterized membrane protein YphA (DoxX/SURF4 family)